MKIVRIDPRTDSRWCDLLQRHRSDVFHTPDWMNTLSATYGFEIEALLVLDDAGRPRSGMAFCQVEDMMDARIVSLPFSDFCDPLVENAADWDQLASALLSHGRRITLRCLHNDVPLADPRFTLTSRAKWHSVDLRRDPDCIWEGLHGAARRAIKKARRQGVEVHIARDKDGLRAFFELHARVRKYKYHLLAQPYRFFEQIWEQFLAPGKGALMLATFEDQVIGGVLFLEWQNTLYYKFNASNPDFISVRPNDLVVWEGIQHGRARGLDFFDFGLSDWDQEGLLQYKRKFATEEKTISFLRFLPDGAPSEKEQQIRRLLPQLTNLYVSADVPDPITEQAGDILYRYFT